MGLHGVLLDWNMRSAYHRFSWDLLRRLHGLSQEPCICGGDFNEVLSLGEKIGGSDSVVPSSIVKL